MFILILFINNFNLPEEDFKKYNMNIITIGCAPFPEVNIAIYNKNNFGQTRE